MLLRRASSLGRLRDVSVSRDAKKPLVRVPSSNKFPRDFFSPAISKKRTGSACQLRTRSSIYVPENPLDFTFMGPAAARSSTHKPMHWRVGLQPKKRGCFLKLSRRLYTGHFGEELGVRS